MVVGWVWSGFRVVGWLRIGPGLVLNLFKMGLRLVQSCSSVGLARGCALFWCRPEVGALVYGSRVRFGLVYAQNTLAVRSLGNHSILAHFLVILVHLGFLGNFFWVISLGCKGNVLGELPNAKKNKSQQLSGISITKPQQANM